VWPPIVRDIFETRPADFPSSLTISEAVNRLAAVVETSELANWAIDCLVGKVAAAKVTIARHRAMRRSGIRPTFVGAFRQMGQTSVLAGEFRYGARARLLLLTSSSWLLFLSLVLVGFAVAFVFLAPGGSGLWIAGGAFLVFVALVAILSRVVQPLSGDDMAWISNRVRVAVMAPNQPHPADGAPRRR
jgi:hypothetical protein